MYFRRSSVGSKPNEGTKTEPSGDDDSECGRETRLARPEKLFMVRESGKKKHRARPMFLKTEPLASGQTCHRGPIGKKASNYTFSVCLQLTFTGLAVSKVGRDINNRDAPSCTRLDVRLAGVLQRTAVNDVLISSPADPWEDSKLPWLASGPER